MTLLVGTMGPGPALAHGSRSVERPSPALLRLLRHDTRQRAAPDGDFTAIDPSMRNASVAVATVPLAYRRGSLSVVFSFDPCGRGSCGSLLFFERRPGSSGFRRILGALSVELPVVLLPSAQHGYPDIGVNVAVHDPNPDSVPAVVVFDGRRYSVTPTPAPGRPAGRLLIDDRPGNFTHVTW